MNDAKHYRTLAGMANLKKLSFLLLVTNCIYLVYTVFLFVYLKERVILDFNNPPRRLQLPIWLSTQELSVILVLVIFAGMIVVLRAFKEKAFIWIAVLVYIALRLLFDVLGIMAALKFISYLNPIIRIGSIISICGLIYLMVSVCFIKSAPVKRYCVWFAVISIVSIVLTPITGYLYNDFGLSWVLINPNILKMPPFIVSLFLFIRLYKTSPLKIA